MNYLRFFNKHSARYIVAVLALVVSVISPLQVFALSPADYASNDVMFFEPGTRCATSAGTTATTAVTLDQNNPVLKQIFTLLVQSGQFNGVQAAAIMGNMYAEYGFNSDAKEGNGIGYGLVQWSFGRRTKLEAFATQKGVPASDIPTQIAFLTQEYAGSYKTNLAKTPFGAGTDVAASTEAWMNIFEAPDNTPPSADKPKLQTKRIPAAIQIYGFFKDIAPAISSASTGSQSCATSNAVIAALIVKTAVSLALPQPATEGAIAKSDASDAYQKAKDQYNPTAEWSDCGGFIATILISSGVDPNYPAFNVANQVAYVNAHPEKYKVITNPTATDLQPGDILLSNSAGHATIYLGDYLGDNKTVYPAADASLGQRVPSLQGLSNSTWMLANGAIIARYIGQSN